VKAFVVLREGATLSAVDLRRHCRSRLESHMVPKVVEFVDTLPRTDTGKIKKSGLG
jgi:long-chain acyl-CoA synthetase